MAVSIDRAMSNHRDFAQRIRRAKEGDKESIEFLRGLIKRVTSAIDDAPPEDVIRICEVFYQVRDEHFQDDKN